MEKSTVFGGYRICTAYDGHPVILKRSALGVVTYQAEDSASKEPAVLKTIPPALFDHERLERLENDVKQARALQHANIAPVLHFGRSLNNYVYVQEYVEGDTAALWVKERGPLPVDVALRIGLQVAQALSAAAFHLSPHRAINPRNVVLASGQTVGGEWPFIKLINFGLAEIEFAEAAKQNGRGLEKDASIFYRSPEHGQRGAIDIRSDIYSLGCTLWFLLTGAPPFAGEGASLLAPAVITEPPVEELMRLPKSMRSLLAYMLRRNPEERPLDPVALIQVIEDSIVRVERRQKLARSVGMPFLAPTYVRRKIKAAAPEAKPAARAPGPFLKAAAAAAVMILLGALGAALGTWQFGANSIFRSSSREKPIGVPIGVPDGSVVSPDANGGIVDAAAAKPAEPSQLIPTVTQTPTIVASANADQSRVDTSVQPSQPAVNPPTPVTVASANTNPGPVATSVQPREPMVNPPTPSSEPPTSSPASNDISVGGVASNETSSADNLAAQNSTAKTAPPAEGPDQNAVAEAAPATPTTPPSPAATAEASNFSTETAANTNEDVDSLNTAQSKASPTPATRSKKIVSQRTKKRHEVRRARPPGSEMASSRRSTRVIRAQYLGTTPDGNWVLGVGGSNGTMVVPPPPPAVARSVLENGVRIALPPN